MGGRNGTPTTYQGIRYRSAFEARVARDLCERGASFTYENVQVFYTTAHIYRPDFLLLQSGVFVEAKGYMPAPDRAKLLAVREQNPSLEIRLLFQNAKTRLARGSKTTYGQWADRNGFSWDQSRVPDEWMKARR